MVGVGFAGAHPLPYPGPPGPFPAPADPAFTTLPVMFSAGHVVFDATGLITLFISDFMFSPAGAFACQDLYVTDPCGSVASNEFSMAFCGSAAFTSASNFDPTRELWVFPESAGSGVTASPCGTAAPTTTGVIGHGGVQAVAGACGYLSLLGAPGTQFFFGGGNVAAQDVHANLDAGASVVNVYIPSWAMIAPGPTHAGGHAPWHAIFGGPLGDDPPQVTAAPSGTDWTVMVPNDDTYTIQFNADLDCDGDLVADSTTWVSWGQFH